MKLALAFFLPGPAALLKSKTISPRTLIVKFMIVMNVRGEGRYKRERERERSEREREREIRTTEQAHKENERA